MWVAVCLTEPSVLSHPSPFAPYQRNQPCPSTCGTRGPRGRPCPRSWGSTTEPQPPKCLQIGPPCLFPPCLPQPEGAGGASREGCSCSCKCSPALFAQHNSDIQGRGLATAGTACLQRRPQVSGLTQARTQTLTHQRWTSGASRSATPTAARTPCPAPHSHPAPSLWLRDPSVWGRSVNPDLVESVTALPGPKHLAFQGSSSSTPDDKKVSAARNELSPFLTEKRFHSKRRVDTLGCLRIPMRLPLVFYLSRSRAAPLVGCAL